MNVKPIKSKKDYSNALKRVEKLWSAKKNSPEGDELEVLSTLIEVYEEKNFKIVPPDPIEAIKFRMEQQGLTRKELVKIIGGANRVSEIFHRKRKLTLKMIRSLFENLHIPIESLIY